MKNYKNYLINEIKKFISENKINEKNINYFDFYLKEKNQIIDIVLNNNKIYKLKIEL